MSKTIATQIAEVAVNTKFENLPEEAVVKAKTLTLDVLASMLGTRDVISSTIAREVAEELGGPAEATIVGSKDKVAAPNAAFANAIQCYGLDFVDDHNESNAHPSPATFPASMALSEMLHRSGKEYIEAVSLGNEVVCRMGTAYLGDMYYQGFHPTSTCGTMGAAVSAAKLMKLDEQKTIYAQGIAGSMVAGLMAWNTEGSFTKRLQAGHPAMNSIIAARMAEKGFNGPSDIFESKDGLLHAYSFHDHYDAKYITEGLGEDWTFTKSSIKVYPCCRYSGGHLDACLEIVNKYHPNPEDKPKLKLNTWLTKESIIKKKILPYFAKRKLSEITAKDIMRWQNEIREMRDCHGKPLSKTYLKTVHNQLSAIFNHAARFYGLNINPARQAGNMGAEERKEMLFWTREEYTKFSEAMMDKPLSFYAFEVLYWCGVREGELLALTPADFDFEKRTLIPQDRHRMAHAGL